MMTAPRKTNNPIAVARHSRYVILALFALALCACGARFMYERLDALAVWYLGGLVSLDGDQRASLERWLVASLDWHRSSELERYAAFLRDFERRLAMPADLATYDEARRTIETFWRDLVGHTLPQAQPLLASLSPAQVEELLANLEEEDRKDARELAKRSDAERAERRGRRIVRSVERWTGRLDGEQRRLLQQESAGLRPLEEARLTNRAAWRAQLRTVLLRAEGDPATEIERLLVDPEYAWTAQYREGLIHNRRRILEMFVALDATLSGEQRDRMRARLGELAGDMESLARE